MRLSLSLLVLAVLAPALAHAGPFEVRDLGDRVEVVAKGWTAVDPSAIAINRERLELVVAGGLKQARQSTEDATVRRVEVRGSEPRVLSIKLRGEHRQAVALAPHATATQVGDELHVVIPRAVPKAAPAPAAPATTATTAAAAPTTAAAATTATTAAAPAPTTAAPAPTPAAATATATVTAPAADAPTTTIPLPPRRRAAASSPITTRWWILLAGLALIGGGGVLLARKKQAAPAPRERIEVIDSKSLGGKARVVWLGAGDRELVVAVGPQQVRLLGQWRRGSRPDGALEIPNLNDEAKPAARGSAPRLKTVPSSPAVSGILRLRDKTSPLADDIASGDPEADEQWARDILAATGGRR